MQWFFCPTSGFLRGTQLLLCQSPVYPFHYAGPKPLGGRTTAAAVPFISHPLLEQRPASVLVTVTGGWLWDCKALPWLKRLYTSPPCLFPGCVLLHARVIPKVFWGEWLCCLWGHQRSVPAGHYHHPAQLTQTAFTASSAFKLTPSTFLGRPFLL